jgi:hypothetical protein
MTASGQDWVLYTVVGEVGVPPSLESAAAQLHAQVTDLDADFGVVSLDPSHGLYLVQAHADRIPPASPEGGPYRGPFAAPKIAPLGSADDSEPDETG